MYILFIFTVVVVKCLCDACKNIARYNALGTDIFEYFLVFRDQALWLDEFENGTSFSGRGRYRFGFK